MPNNSYKLLIAMHRLGRQLHRAYHHEHAHHHNHYREQSHLLILIAENDGIMQRDLAEKMDVRPSSMTEMITKMENAGFITRQKDEKDQRIMHIFLTEKGKSSVEDSQKNDVMLTASLFQGLTDEEITEMLRLTEKLSAHLNTVEAAQFECFHHYMHTFAHKMCQSLSHHKKDAPSGEN